MTSRRPVACVLALLAACGEPPGPTPEGPTLLAVNGASHPLLGAEAVFVAIGRGFGSEQGNGLILVTGAAGMEPATIVSWTDDAITAQLPTTSQSGTITVVRDAGDTVGSLQLVVAAADLFNPTTLDWKAGPSLPRAFVAGGATVHFPGSPTLPGVFGVVPQDVQAVDTAESVYMGIGSASGGIDRFVPAPQDSGNIGARRLSAWGGIDGTNSRITRDSGAQFESGLYLAGGLDPAGSAIAQVFALGIDRNGEYGFWTPVNALPEPRAAASAIVAFGNLIVAGGFGRDSVARREVFLAVVRPTAALNGWFSGPPLPEGRAFGTLVLQDDVLYYIGGETGFVTPDSTDAASPRLRGSVYAARLSRRSGFFADSAWTEVGQLMVPRSRHAAFAVNGGILVSAGTYAGAPSVMESEFASALAGGSLGTFTIVTAPTITDRGGAGLSGMGFTILRDSRWVPHPIMAGGAIVGAGFSDRVWWH